MGYVVKEIVTNSVHVILARLVPQTVRVLILQSIHDLFFLGISQIWGSSFSPGSWLFCNQIYNNCVSGMDSLPLQLGSSSACPLHPLQVSCTGDSPQCFHYFHLSCSSLLAPFKITHYGDPSANILLTLNQSK